MKLAELLALRLDEQDRLVQSVTKRKEKAKDATKQWKDSTPELGKLYFALEIRLNRGQRTTDENGKPCTPTFAQSMSLGDLIYSVTKEKSDGKALQCKNAFGCFVGEIGNGFVKEEVYDRIPSNVLELSGRIAKELGFDLTKPEMKTVAEELNRYGKNTIGTLRELLKTLVPAAPMEFSDAQEAAEKLDIDGNLGVMIAAIVRRAPCTVAEVLANEIPNLTSLNGKRVFTANVKAAHQFGNVKDENGKRKFADEMLDAWAEEYTKANAPVEIVTKDKPKKTAPKAPEPVAQAQAA